MSAKAKRQQRREQNRRRKLRTNLIWAGVGLVALVVIGFAVWQTVKPSSDETFPIMVSSPHIPTESDPGTYNSDPPTSGPHYDQEAQAGFYDENIYQYPAGYLVHNLEHGYIIFWYNCEGRNVSACSDLKSQIKTAMDDLGGTKLIAYPWPSLNVPVVATSWGRMLKFESFHADQAKAFYRANLNKAPEPNAP